MISFAQLTEMRKPAEIEHFRRTVSRFTEPDSRTADEWQTELPELMGRYGFKQLGTGKFGSVFGNPNYPYIIKVFMKDTAYLKWLDFAKQNQSNPFVPKIRGKVVKISPNFMAVRLEKLTPSLKDEWMDWDSNESNPNVSTILDFFDRNASLMDLHGGNFMMRGNQIVIIDPFYNWFKGGRFTMDPHDISQFKSLFVKV